MFAASIENTPSSCPFCAPGFATAPRVVLILVQFHTHYKVAVLSGATLGDESVLDQREDSRVLHEPNVV